MNSGQLYWTVIDPIWDKVSIYDTPELFLHQFEKLTPAQQHLFASHWCQSEVRNGGFHQFFSNATGILAPEAEAGFRAIGLEACASLVEEAMNHFGSPYPREQEVREANLDALQGSTRAEWDPFRSLDDRFYEAIANDGYERAADEFASRSSAA